MKKLLSLLSVLTISGTAVPTTIAASPYQKEEQIIYNDLVKNPKSGFLKFIFNTQNGNINTKILNVNEKIYFGTDNGKIYEYDIKTKKINTVFTSNMEIKNNDWEDISESKPLKFSSGFVNDEKIYFWEGTVSRYFEYNTLNKNKSFLGENEGYNSIFGRSMPSVLVKNFYFNKSNNSIGIRTIFNLNQNNEYLFGEGIILNNSIYFSYEKKIYKFEPFKSFLINDIVTDMEEISMIGIYLYYKKQNPNYEFKDILEINLNDLRVFDVNLKESENGYIYKSFLNDQITNICYTFNSEFENNSSIEQTQYTNSCSEQVTETTTFQKLNGFAKTKNELNSKLKSETDSKADNKNWSWNWNSKATVKYSAEGGVPLVTKHKIEVGLEVGAGETRGEQTTLTNSKTKQETISFSVGDTSTSSDTKINTNTKTKTISIVAQPIKIPPYNKISSLINSKKITIESILNLNQKVIGNITAKIIDENDNYNLVSVSIKDMMLILKENNLLPLKIEINNTDESINFNYDVSFIKEIIKHKTIIGKNIALN